MTVAAGPFPSGVSTYLSTTSLCVRSSLVTSYCGFLLFGGAEVSENVDQEDIESNKNAESIDLDGDCDVVMLENGILETGRRMNEE